MVKLAVTRWPCQLFVIPHRSVRRRDAEFTNTPDHEFGRVGLPLRSPWGGVGSGLPSYVACRGPADR